MQLKLSLLLLTLEDMRKLIAIFFLFVFSFATTELGQFFKLPVLVQHFYTHQKQEGMTLFDFLAEHYVGEHEDEDKQDDMQLPFKSMISGPSAVANFPIHKIELKRLVVQKKQLAVSLQVPDLPSQLVFGVFHPPRTV